MDLMYFGDMAAFNNVLHKKQNWESSCSVVKHKRKENMRNSKSFKIGRCNCYS